MNQNKIKVTNFLNRVKVYEEQRQQKMDALRFLEDKYDSKNGQLKFYPKIQSRKATQKYKYWKDADGFEKVPEE